MIEGKYTVIVIEYKVGTAATKHILNIGYSYHYQNEHMIRLQILETNVSKIYANSVNTQFRKHYNFASVYTIYHNFNPHYHYTNGQYFLKTM